MTKRKKPTIKPIVGVPAYELPPLTESQVVVDAQTVNKDGSVWVSQSSTFLTGKPVAVGKVQVAYGYISPKKCPRLWELARKVLGAAQFQDWENDWKEHPYGIYTWNPADTTTASMEDLVQVNNAFFFHFKVHRIRDYVQ